MGRIVNLGKEVTATSPNGKGYRKLYDANAYSSLTQILSISGSGFLKSSFNVNSVSAGNYIAQIQIVIDGETVLNIRNNPTPLNNLCAHGIADQILCGLGSAGLPILPVCGSLPGTAINGSLAAIATTPLLYPYSEAQLAAGDGGLFIIPHPIRFNTSLAVSVIKDSSNLKTVCEYYLDD
jgi:hypothetical protein